MEKSGSNLIKLNQHDVKIMLQDRILNPTKYLNKPLLLWRANFNDGILRQVFFNFDPHVAALFKHQSDKQQNGKEEAALPRWVPVKLDSLNNNIFSLPVKDLNRVYCFILELSDINLISPPTYGEYSDFINSDWLIRIQEMVKAPIVVFLPFIEQPRAFKEYCQYIFTPDFGEWKETLAASRRSLIRHLVGFLESSVSENERDYRWYWFFQKQKDGSGSSGSSSLSRKTGCDFPSCWDLGINNLIRRYTPPMAQIPKDYIPKKPVRISEIATSEFKNFFNKGISEDVIEDFRNYLIKHNVEL